MAKTSASHKGRRPKEDETSRDRGGGAKMTMTPAAAAATPKPKTSPASKTPATSAAKSAAPATPAGEGIAANVASPSRPSAAAAVKTHAGVTPASAKSATAAKSAVPKLSGARPASTPTDNAASNTNYPAAATPKAHTSATKNNVTASTSTKNVAKVPAKNITAAFTTENLNSNVANKTIITTNNDSSNKHNNNSNNNSPNQSLLAALSSKISKMKSPITNTPYFSSMAASNDATAASTPSAPTTAGEGESSGARATVGGVKGGDVAVSGAIGANCGGSGSDIRSGSDIGSGSGTAKATGGKGGAGPIGAGTTTSQPSTVKSINPLNVGISPQPLSLPDVPNTTQAKDATSPEMKKKDGNTKSAASVVEGSGGGGGGGGGVPNPLHVVGGGGIPIPFPPIVPVPLSPAVPVPPPMAGNGTTPRPNIFGLVHAATVTGIAAVSSAVAAVASNSNANHSVEKTKNLLGSVSNVIAKKNTHTTNKKDSQSLSSKRAGGSGSTGATAAGATTATSVTVGQKKTVTVKKQGVKSTKTNAATKSTTMKAAGGQVATKTTSSTQTATAKTTVATIATGEVKGKESTQQMERILRPLVPKKKAVATSVTAKDTSAKGNIMRKSEVQTKSSNSPNITVNKGTTIKATTTTATGTSQVKISHVLLKNATATTTIKLASGSPTQPSTSPDNTATTETAVEISTGTATSHKKQRHEHQETQQQQQHKSRADVSNVKWFENYQRLKKFKMKHGHCRVPRRFVDNPHFGTWVANQRAQYRAYIQSKNEKEHIDNNVRYNGFYDERYRLLYELGFEAECKRGQTNLGGGKRGGGSSGGGGTNITSSTKEGGEEGVKVRAESSSPENEDMANALKATKSEARKMKSSSLTLSTTKRSAKRAQLKYDSSLSSPNVLSTTKSSHERRDKVRRDRYEVLVLAGLGHLADKYGKSRYGFADDKDSDTMDNKSSSPPLQSLLAGATTASSQLPKKRKDERLQSQSIGDDPSRKRLRTLSGDNHASDVDDSPQDMSLATTIRVYRIHDIVSGNEPGAPPLLSFSSSSVHHM